MPFLVVPLLPGWRSGSVCGGVCQPTGGMADLASGSAASLLGLWIVPSLSRQVGGGKETGRDRKTARRRGGRAALAHHRVPGAGHRSQGPYLAHTSAAHARIRGGGGEVTGFPRGRNRSPPRGRSVA